MFVNVDNFVMPASASRWRDWPSNRVAYCEWWQWPDGFRVWSFKV